jgi:ADP-ribose pyrophosphatase YjhB (NUDIX family)
VASYVVCTDEEQRLLLCRLTELTNRPGWWTLPGGGVEFGEHPEAAALRELDEETGLKGRLGELLCVDSMTGPVRADDGANIEMHRIRFVYAAKIVGGELRHETGGTSDRAQWFTQPECAEIDLADVASLGVRLAWRRPRSDRTGAERGVDQ